MKRLLVYILSLMLCLFFLMGCVETDTPNTDIDVASDIESAETDVPDSESSETDVPLVESIESDLSASESVEADAPESEPIITCSTPFKLGKPDLKMSDEQAEAMIAILESLEWREGEVDFTPQFEFKYLGAKIFYSYDGLFSDVSHGRYVSLSEEEKQAVNDLINKFIVLPIID